MSTPKRKMINEALYLLRLYCGYSQAKLSKKLGISQSMISEIESGAKSVSMDALQTYSDKLGIKMSQLLFFAEEIDGEPPFRRGKLILAGKALTILEKLAPDEVDFAT